MLCSGGPTAAACGCAGSQGGACCTRLLPRFLLLLLIARCCPTRLAPQVLAAKTALGVRVDALGDVNDEGAVGLAARAKVC